MPIAKILTELRIIRIRANGLRRRSEAEQEARDFEEQLARESAAIDGIRSYNSRE